MAELHLAAKVKWYEIGIVSQEMAAEISGLTKAEFIFSLACFSLAALSFRSQTEAWEREKYRITNTALHAHQNGYYLIHVRNR